MGSEEELKNYLRAGEIGFKVKEFARKFVKPGMKLVEVAEVIESKIRELGGQPAFPLNVSIDYVAAHRTPLIDDDEVVPEDSVVKIDIGVHVEGYIADTAITLVFNDKYSRMAEVNEEALRKGLRKVKPGIRFSDVGAVIGTYISRSGYRVVKNLTGHSLGRYLIHAGDIVPNYRDPLTFGRFKVGRAYAIEPFVTDGKGLVAEVRGSVQIYALKRSKLGDDLSSDERQLLEAIIGRFRTLPFCERWLSDVTKDVAKLRSMFSTLVRKGYLMQYPVLIEVSRGIVTQFEETVYISKDGAIITTNPEIKQ